jgi:hypothetical protein
MSKHDKRIKITFAESGNAPELEVTTPVHCNAGTRMWTALASLRINPRSAYLVRTGPRLIAHVKLTERDGTPLSQHRAVEVMSLLKERLFGRYDDDVVTQASLVRGGHRDMPGWPSTDPTGVEDQRTV